MDDEPRTKHAPPPFNWGVATVVSLMVGYVLWHTGIQWVREAVVFVLFVCWIAGLCYARLLGIGYAIRFINRIAEKFVNPPGPNPDDKS